MLVKAILNVGDGMILVKAITEVGDGMMLVKAVVDVDVSEGSS